MATPIIEETSGRVRVAPLSVDQFEAMISKGILPEGAPIELIDGMLVSKDRAATGDDPMSVGPRHSVAILRVIELAPLFRERGCHLRGQMPIRIPPGNEPEPDVAVVTGDVSDYSRRHPDPSEVPCVIEVADSSLHYDRTTKARIYASAGIRQYVIVNLVADQIEFLDRPRSGRYSRKAICRGSRSLGIALGRKTVRIEASFLLP